MFRCRLPLRAAVPLVVVAGTVGSFLVVLVTSCASKSSNGGGDDTEELEAGLDVSGGDGVSGVDEASGPSGFVLVSTGEQGGGSLGAVFDGTPVLRSQCHVTMEYGACAVYACPAEPDAGPPPTAGTLTFSGGSLDAGVTVSASATGIYESDTASPPFAPGQTLVVTAAGGSVPAFGPESVSTPDLLGLTSPADDGGALTVATAQDFGFTWGGGGQDSLAILTASGVTADQGFVLARCSYVAITGEGILPSTVLGAVQGLSQGEIGWGQANEALFDAGAWSVTLLAGTYGSVPATFQ